MINKINSYKLGKDDKKDFLLLLLAFVLFLAYGIAFQIHRGWYTADCYVTTLLAFSYLRDGFCRRGLIGTIFDLIARVIPSIVSYKGAMWFMWGMNVIYFASLLLFIRWALKKIKNNGSDKTYIGAYWLSIISLAFLVPTACTWNGALGRADLIQMAICLFQIYLLVEKKWEWLTVPLTAINVLFHEGYLCMTFAAVIIMVIYRALNTKGKRAYYWTIFGLNIAVLGALSIISLEGGGNPGTQQGFDAALEYAKSLNVFGAFHSNLMGMMARFQSQTITYSNDAVFKMAEIKEAPIFLIVGLPFIIFFVKGFVNMIRCSKKEKLGTHITAVALGPILVGVEYYLFCDFGRYVIWLIFYFFTVLLAFSVMDDKGSKESLAVSYGGLTNFKAILFTALMMIYQPIPTTNFTLITSKIMRMLKIG